MCHASEQDLNGQEKNDLVGCYANYFRVGFNACEFVCDFGQFYPEKEALQFYTRITTSPTYMKNLIELLHASFQAYQAQYGIPASLAAPTETPVAKGCKSC